MTRDRWASRLSFAMILGAPPVGMFEPSRIATKAAISWPPRPNLGPEPWPETNQATGPVVVAITLGLLTLAALAWFVGRRPWRRRRAGGSSPEGLEPRFEGGPRDRLIAAADEIRSALIERLGPTWAGRTTEELAHASELALWLGPERAEAVHALFVRADQVKFDLAGASRDPIDPESVARWESLVATTRELLARPRRNREGSLRSAGPAGPDGKPGG